MKTLYKNYIIEVKRIQAQVYQINLGEYTCNIEHFKSNIGTSGWIVIAAWNRYIYSDYINTYADAKITAFELLIQFHEGNKF